MPENTKYVGRPTKWGNPWHVHEHTRSCAADRFLLCPELIAYSAEDAVRKYRHVLLYPCSGDPFTLDHDDIYIELRGLDLACWCPLDVPCHADVLLELANR